MGSEVRFARDESEGDAGVQVVSTAFLERADEETTAFTRSQPDGDRRIVALEDGAVCGTARSFATPLTVPGGSILTMAAVSGVGVLPTHRRRGHLGRMMALQLEDVVERGEPIAGLIAAEWPIYGQYGYGPGVWAASYEVDRRLVRFGDSSWHGTIEFVDLPALRELAPPMFEAHRAATPGSIGRNDWWWDVQYGVTPRPGWKDERNRFRAVHRAPSGELDGYVTYSTTGSWERNIPSGTVEIGELCTISPGAYVDLWRFVLELDWTASLKVAPRPVDEHLPLLLVDGRAVTQTHRGDHIWLRILDIPSVLTARSYRAGDGLVLDVVDASMGRGGRYRLDTEPDGATCTPTTEAADLRLPISSLGAACLGGTPVATLAAAGLVDEESVGAVGRADAVFGWTPAPWCSTGF